MTTAHPEAPRPFFSAGLPALRWFSGLFDPAYESRALVVRTPLWVAFASAWRVYRDMRTACTPWNCLSVVSIRGSAIAQIWTAIALSLWAVAELAPAALPLAVVFLAWFRQGLWHLWWSTVHALTFVGFALLEILEILAAPKPENGYPTLTFPCAAYAVVWGEGKSRRRVVGAACLALVLPVAWVVACAAALVAVVGLVTAPIGAVSAVIVIGGFLDPQATLQRCLRRSLILFCGEALGWWWPAPEAATIQNNGQNDEREQ